MRREQPLSRNRVVDAALGIVEREGVEAVTMRRLAEELRTAPASLYRHVASREELLRRVGERILDEIDVDFDAGASWQERTIAWAGATRRALRRSRGSVVLLMGPSTPAPENYSLYQAAIDDYVAAGLPVEVANAMAQAIVFVVLSFADLESQWPDALAVAPGSLLEGGRQSSHERPNDEMFDFLIGSVIAGVERRLASPSPTET